uniref:Protein kinase domain-containing protein n=1 Tax=Brassica oleracea var. oleracea TaxID=109376 RepID=A0A0D3CUD6_BRAOL
MATGKYNPIKFFSADKILKATKSFSKCSLVLEPFDHERWYSGTLDNHRKILVTQPSNPKGSFPEVRDIADVGCCLETEVPVMVYYVERKQYCRVDLEKIVSWEKRVKIAEEIATALAYLHTAFKALYGAAKLGDFSNCVSIPQGETYVKLGYVRGAYDYIDDEYMNNGVVSEKTGAFGFGVLMQKLFTREARFRELYGRKNWKTLLKRKFPRCLSRSIEEGRFDEIVDSNMLEKIGEVAEIERFQMEAFLVLTERCIGLRGEVPNMVQVVKELKRSLQNPSSSFVL